MVIKSFLEIFKAMKNYMIANQNHITDFNEGSVISSFLEAVAREMERLYIKCRMGYDFYLKSLPFSIFNFTEKKGTFATGSVVFSRKKATGNDIIIPVGTQISVGNLKFITTSVGIISRGLLESPEIPIRSVEIGLKFNVSAGTITTIDSVLSSEVSSVTNKNKTFGGSDNEKESEYLSRFREYILGLQGTNLYGLSSIANQLDTVRSVSVVEHFPPLDNIYNATVYVEDGTGNATPDTITGVKKYIDGDGTKINPGRRSPGINIRVLPPTIVPITINATVTTYRADKDVARSECIDAMKQQINSLKIGEGVTLTSIILLLRRISYVKDVRITFPEDNVVIGTDQIARFEAAIITVENL